MRVGNGNTAVGIGAVAATGSNNVAVGASAWAQTTGNANTAVGRSALARVWWPAKTGDSRRFPDYLTDGGITEATAWIDGDLRALVIAAYEAWAIPADDNTEDLRAFINILDAAIDEQDRRNAVEPRPVVREL